MGCHTLIVGLFSWDHQNLAALGAVLSGCAGIAGALVALRISQDRTRELEESRCQERLDELRNEYNTLILEASKTQANQPPKPPKTP